MKIESEPSPKIDLFSFLSSTTGLGVTLGAVVLDSFVVLFDQVNNKLEFGTSNCASTLTNEKKRGVGSVDVRPDSSPYVLLPAQAFQLSILLG